MANEGKTYIQIIPSIDWYFRHKDDEGTIVYPLAAWALTNDGEMVGLVAVRDPNTGYPILKRPQIVGDFLNKEQIADEKNENSARLDRAFSFF